MTWWDFICVFLHSESLPVNESAPLQTQLKRSWKLKINFFVKINVNEWMCVCLCTDYVKVMCCACTIKCRLENMMYRIISDIINIMNIHSDWGKKKKRYAINYLRVNKIQFDAVQIYTSNELNLFSSEMLWFCCIRCNSIQYNKEWVE